MARACPTAYVSTPRPNPRVVFERLFSAALLCLGPWTFQPTLPAAAIDLRQVRVTEKDLNPPSILLLPIVRIEQTLDRVDTLLQKPEGWEEALGILSRAPFTKQEFKDTFNAFSDNVVRLDYVVLPGVGKTVPPRTLQSIQYLYRNEALDNVEALRAEIEYLMDEQKKGTTLTDEDVSGLKEFSDKARDNVKQYLALANQDDVKSIRNALAAATGGKVDQ